MYYTMLIDMEKNREVNWDERVSYILQRNGFNETRVSQLLCCQ